MKETPKYTQNGSVTHQRSVAHHKTGKTIVGTLCIMLNINTTHWVWAITDEVRDHMEELLPEVKAALLRHVQDSIFDPSFPRTSDPGHFSVTLQVCLRGSAAIAMKPLLDIFSIGLININLMDEAVDRERIQAIVMSIETKS